jgi:hypothetical protein
MPAVCSFPYLIDNRQCFRCSVKEKQRFGFDEIDFGKAEINVVDIVWLIVKRLSRTLL